jgi:hypothetical protein
MSDEPEPTTELPYTVRTLELSEGRKLYLYSFAEDGQEAGEGEGA